MTGTGQATSGVVGETSGRRLGGHTAGTSVSGRPEAGGASAARNAAAAAALERQRHARPEEGYGPEPTPKQTRTRHARRRRSAIRRSHAS